MNSLEILAVGRYIHSGDGVRPVSLNCPANAEDHLFWNGGIDDSYPHTTAEVGVSVFRGFGQQWVARMEEGNGPCSFS